MTPTRLPAVYLWEFSLVLFNSSFPSSACYPTSKKPFLGRQERGSRQHPYPSPSAMGCREWTPASPLHQHHSDYMLSAFVLSFSKLFPLLFLIPHRHHFRYISFFLSFLPSLPVWMVFWGNFSAPLRAILLDWTKDSFRLHYVSLKWPARCI